jgi:hypothetical protein
MLDCLNTAHFSDARARARARPFLVISLVSRPRGSLYAHDLLSCYRFCSSANTFPNSSAVGESLLLLIVLSHTPVLTSTSVSILRIPVLPDASEQSLYSPTYPMAFRHHSSSPFASIIAAISRTASTSVRLPNSSSPALFFALVGSSAGAAES